MTDIALRVLWWVFGAYMWLSIGIVVAGIVLAIPLWMRERRRHPDSAKTRDLGSFVVGTAIMFALILAVSALRHLS